MRILLVEDNPHDIDLMSYTLRGVLDADELMIARSKMELVGLLETHQDIQCVVLDLYVPSLGFDEAITMIRQYEPNCAVICTSGAMTDERGFDTIRHGADDFVKKEYMHRDLPRAVMREVIKRETRTARKGAVINLQEIAARAKRGRDEDN